MNRPESEFSPEITDLLEEVVIKGWAFNVIRLLVNNAASRLDGVDNDTNIIGDVNDVNRIVNITRRLSQEPLPVMLAIVSFLLTGLWIRSKLAQMKNESAEGGE